eukprot:3724984-Alexandrium_andersonii.AAC.1
MSASLVGSEMCIRDRSKPNLANVGDLRWGRRVLPPAWRLWRAHWAVSYTHQTLPTICSV